jgi:ubiquinone/menaquinone biosynthesis C-methylase UbiE
MPITSPVSPNALRLLEQTASTYDRIAERYARENGIRPGELEASIQRFSRLLPPHGTVLDAGCGIGRDTRWFCAHGFDAVGIDVSEKMLEIAKREGAGDFRKMDARKLDFPAGAFAGVWCSALLVHLAPEEAETALRECGRVLGDCGICFVSTKEGRGYSVDATTYPPEQRFMQLYSEEAMRELALKTGWETLNWEKSEGWIRLLLQKSNG